MNQPFWKDEPEALRKYPQSLMSLLRIYGIFFQGMIVVLPALVLWFLSPVWTFIWLGYMIFIFGVSYYRIRRRKTALNQVRDIQNHAVETIGASHIGSAIHVGGHPLLEREQPVVLALVKDQINIYAYESSTPLDTIALNNLQVIHTVVYDDERVPHIDVIDSAAQALQITFLYCEQPCTCLFRRMRKVRPIDWYHAIQQARLTSKTN
jgi:hypothetical protein